MARSVCCRRQGAVLYCRQHDGAKKPHIEKTVDTLMAAIHPEARVANGYLEHLNEADFRKRLQLAERGKLEPVTHVKAVNRNPPALNMFEIRWTEIAVIEVDPVTGLYGEETSIHVRLYHVEEHGSRWFVALHAHEKILADTPEETAALQDAEIDQAFGLAISEAPIQWGVRELHPPI